MTTAAVVLASTTALDVVAARRLADYGDLDDAGVARALEQVYIQRWGRDDLPGHLRRFASLAAIVVDNGRPQLIAPGTDSDERTLLTALFESWPAASVELVDWEGAIRSLLIARAIAHELRLPAGFEQTRSCALADFAAPMTRDHPVPATVIETECLRLLTDWAPATADDPGALPELARARYHLWVRWQYCRGDIDAGQRVVRTSGLSPTASGSPR